MSKQNMRQELEFLDNEDDLNSDDYDDEILDDDDDREEVTIKLSDLKKLLQMYPEIASQDMDEDTLLDMLAELSDHKSFLPRLIKAFMHKANDNDYDYSSLMSDDSDSLDEDLDLGDGDIVKEEITIKKLPKKLTQVLDSFTGNNINPETGKKEYFSLSNAFRGLSSFLPSFGSSSARNGYTALPSSPVNLAFNSGARSGLANMYPSMAQSIFGRPAVNYAQNLGSAISSGLGALGGSAYRGMQNLGNMAYNAPANVGNYFRPANPAPVAPQGFFEGHLGNMGRNVAGFLGQHAGGALGGFAGGRLAPLAGGALGGALGGPVGAFLGNWGAVIPGAIGGNAMGRFIGRRVGDRIGHGAGAGMGRVIDGGIQAVGNYVEPRAVAAAQAVDRFANRAAPYVAPVGRALLPVVNTLANYSPAGLATQAMASRGYMPLNQNPFAGGAIPFGMAGYDLPVDSPRGRTRSSSSDFTEPMFGEVDVTTPFLTRGRAPSIDSVD